MSPREGRPWLGSRSGIIKGLVMLCFGGPFEKKTP